MASCVLGLLALGCDEETADTDAGMDGTDAGMDGEDAGMDGEDAGGEGEDGGGEDAFVPPSSATFSVTIENAGTARDFASSGTFDTPVGESTPGPIGPGQSYEFQFKAPPGGYLSFATMFAQSNDWFYAPVNPGIALYDGSGNPISGDVTAQIQLYDAGTEEDQPAGTGSNQAPRQGGDDTGPADDDATVRTTTEPTFTVTSGDPITVSITNDGVNLFTVTVATDAAVSTGVASSEDVLLSPGVFVVHGDDAGAPLFTVGEAEPGQGLEALAEDGNNSPLGSYVQDHTGITPVLSAGVWAVHDTDHPIFTPNEPDPGEGLEALAEDGAPTALATSLMSAAGVSSAGVFDTPVGAGAEGPLTPGETYRFAVTAEPGDRLSFATMFVPSNDLFLAPDGMGIALFDSAGAPISGEVTAMVMLWDAGTEVNEEPGFGPDSVQFQSGPNTGEDQDGNVVSIGDVSDGFTYPTVGDVVVVTITPEP